MAANYGPLHAYRDARMRLEDATAAVEELETQKVALKSELGRLTEAGYLESLAREELTYARPGEEVFIVTDATDEESATLGTEAGVVDPELTAADDAAGAPSGSEDQRGPFERFLSAIAELF